jgi:hypothetical protein
MKEEDMRRHAVLMKLKEGVTRQAVRELCEMLRRVADPKWLAARHEQDKDGKFLRACAPRPKTDAEIVQPYDDEYGDPVFYIP